MQGFVIKPKSWNLMYIIEIIINLFMKTILSHAFIKFKSNIIIKLNRIYFDYGEKPSYLNQWNSLDPECIMHA